ncbi:MAG: DinB family protein [Pyrinomonadaceae bacterium]
MLDYFRRLFAYDEWAIARSLGSIDGSVESEAKLLLSHILLAEKIWLVRLSGKDSSTVRTFEQLPINECEKMAADIHQWYVEFIDSLAEPDLDRPITYKNTKGVEFSTPIREILTHVGLHGVYHRGQIAWLVREGGGTAINTDFITFTRI